MSYVITFDIYGKSELWASIFLKFSHKYRNGNIWTTQKEKILQLIHSADQRSRQVVIIVFARVVRPSVRPHFSKSSKTKQSENNVHCRRDCGSGRVDHWWHLSCSSYNWRIELLDYPILKRAVTPLNWRVILINDQDIFSNAARYFFGFPLKNFVARMQLMVKIMLVLSLLMHFTNIFGT